MGSKSQRDVSTIHSASCFGSKPMHAHALVRLGISRSSLDYYQSHLLQFISHFLSLTNRLEDNHQVVENVFLNNIVSNFGPLNLLDLKPVHILW